MGNAAHIAGYVGLDGPYSKKHVFDHFNEEYQLLNRTEMAKLEPLNMDSGSVVFKTLVTWCMQVIDKGEKAKHFTDTQAVELHQKVMEFRAAMDGIYNHTEQPVQFFYIHFLVLISEIGESFGSNWEVELLNLTFVLLQS